MEEKIPPVKPEKPIQKPPVVAPKPSGLNKMLVPVLVILLIVIVVLISTIIFLFKRNTVAPITTTQPTQNTNPQPTSINTTDWKTYTNAEAGFSLKYPSSVLFEGETKGATQPVLMVSVQKLSSIPEDLPSLMGRKDALLQKEQLLKGEAGDVKIGSLYGSLGMTLAQFEMCSVILTRSITFYPGDFRVIISLAGPKAAIMDSMPDFFTVDEANCGTKRIWNQDKIATFEQTLAAKKGQGAGQDWYDTFDAIVKTITLTAPSVTAPLTDLSTYKNEKYGFEISYPKSYKALDDAENLYGYPHGIVLLYEGGQAYDVVIEVWDTKAAYESNYSSRLSDVTVVESNGKFITLLNNTQSPDNEKIIASFKLLP